MGELTTLHTRSRLGAIKALAVPLEVIHARVYAHQICDGIEGSSGQHSSHDSPQVASRWEHDQRLVGPDCRDHVIHNVLRFHNVDEQREREPTCLLYTSDAADEEDSVDLGGRRIIKKKKKKQKGGGKSILINVYNHIIDKNKKDSTYMF
eukprot:TRINITY_DN9110_c0_g2_i3.p1 TRINITY_DN9110_c0_g2~~TRINITY_DN9110_c0_g2_i3.p1  ORF type:complete len:150 (-),score=13.76 TRINITY_DN9110_c0_g2_i3:16-465(-)